jgi:DNA-binding PadR family transcriptional regulator
MLMQVGDDAVRHWEFKADEDFPETVASTWRELVDEGLIDVARQAFGGFITYRMTARGWLEALKLKPDIDQDCVEIASRVTDGIPEESQ